MRSSDVSDASLVAGVRAGDGRAFRAIHDRHGPLVRDIVRARLGRQDDAADAVQEVFVAAWTGIGGLSDPACLRPWLAQIARRTAIDHGRRAARAPVVADPALGVVPDPGAGPEDEACARDLARRLDHARRGLRPRDATAVRLGGDGPDVVAAALGVSPATAKVIVHRARRRLRAAVAA